MAVKTQLTEAEFIDLLSNYNLGELRCIEPVASGTIQTNYFIQTTQDKYVFRLYENRSRESVLFETSLLAFLTKKNYPCPAPYKNKKGRYSGLYHEKPYVIFEFMKGQHLENPSLEQKRQLVKRVAELHIITQNYVPRYKKFRWNYGIELCRELAQGNAQRINTPNAWAKLEWYNRALADLSLPKSLPKGICHCDFHFSNVLFNQGEFAALIDFDDANFTYLTYDLATLIEPFIPGFDWDTWQQFEPGANVFDFSEGREVIREYMKHRPLNEIEKQHIYDVFKLSVMLDCLWYYERGDVNDFFERRKINYLNRLGRERFYGELFSEQG